MTRHRDVCGQTPHSTSCFCLLSDDAGGGEIDVRQVTAGCVQDVAQSHRHEFEIRQQALVSRLRQGCEQMILPRRMGRRHCELLSQMLENPSWIKVMIHVALKNINDLFPWPQLYGITLPGRPGCAVCARR